MSWRHLTKKEREWIYLMLLDRSPLDEPDEEYAEILENIQANLLR